MFMSQIVCEIYKSTCMRNLLIKMQVFSVQEAQWSSYPDVYVAYIALCCKFLLLH